MSDKFYIDCEFDGHDGPLLSIAMVKDDGTGIYVNTTSVAEDPWVVANVVPLLDLHDCRMAVRCLPNEVGAVLRTFIDSQKPIIVADSPVDIARFCRAISTGADGGWASAEYPRMTFEVHNVDCYPTTLEGAVQHNAWWDAMALRAALRETHHLVPRATGDDREMVELVRQYDIPICNQAADRIEALTAENEKLRTHLAAVRDEVLEEAAKVADGFHERALEWAKSVRGLTEHLTETDSSRIATTIRAMKGDGK